MEDNAGYLNGPSVVTVDLMRKRGRQKSEREEEMITEADVGMMGGHKQGMWAVSKSWKRQGNGFSFRYSTENTTLLTS